MRPRNFRQPPSGLHAVRTVRRVEVASVGIPITRERVGPQWPGRLVGDGPRVRGRPQARVDHGHRAHGEDDRQCHQNNQSPPHLNLLVRLWWPHLVSDTAVYRQKLPNSSFFQPEKQRIASTEGSESCETSGPPPETPRVSRNVEIERPIWGSALSSPLIEFVRPTLLEKDHPSLPCPSVRRSPLRPSAQAFRLARWRPTRVRSGE